MNYRLYVCQNCKQAFYYEKSEKHQNICRNCLQDTLKEQTENIIFVCPLCHRHYDGSILLSNPILGRKKFQIHLGKLLCPKDNHPLEMRSLKDEIENLTSHLLDQRSEIEIPEITEESKFLEKINKLREEVMEDMPKRQPIPKKASSNSKDQAVTSSAVDEETEITFIEPIDYNKVIPTPPPFTPYANDFWQFYFKEKNFTNSRMYLGKTRAPQKIRNLLEEVSQYILNPSKIKLSIPLYEIISSGKVIYIGDTHGSVEDTDNIITYCVKEIEKAKNNGYEIRIIFGGDYVDRNDKDIHNILYIFAFALKYPKQVRLLRGNHEEVTINMQYGFWENLNEQLPNSYLFNDFEYLFMNLPLVHVIESKGKRIMYVHGGIPFYDQGYEQMPIIPNLMSGQDRLDSKHATVDEMDVLSQQILWSDPVGELPPQKLFLPNPRGIGFSFGEEVFTEWCRVNHIDRVVRGHEVFVDGHREYFNQRLFSLFSNSHYLGRHIDAKILEFDFNQEWDSNWRYITIQEEI